MNSKFDTDVGWKKIEIEVFVIQKILKINVSVVFIIKVIKVIKQN